MNKNSNLEENNVNTNELNKKNYVKITPTFYIQRVLGDENFKDNEEVFKILNPETGVVEKRPLTDTEKREIIIKELKESKIKFKNSTHKGNITVTKFGSEYKKKRKKKNKMTKISRKANRRKKH